MKLKILVAVLGFSTLLAFPGFAKEGQLYLFKDQSFDTSPIMQDERFADCDQLFKVALEKDVPDMRRDFDYYFCEGMYTLRLDGPKGTTLTLFGNFFYGQGGGYLVLKKLDDRMLWLLDLEEFPAERWMSFDAGKDSGAFEAYYHPAPNFRKNLSSLKWGQWWKGGPSASPGESTQ